jgi:hypothetical protein
MVAINAMASARDVAIPPEVTTLTDLWCQESIATEVFGEYFRWCSIVKSSAGTFVE